MAGVVRDVMAMDDACNVMAWEISLPEAGVMMLIGDARMMKNQIIGKEKSPNLVEASIA